jgi:transcriptional accessory protein Tex/SPT6
LIREIKYVIFILQEWSEAEFVAHQQQIDMRTAQNIIHLLDEENTIPFIARYRKELTNDIPPEKLRDVKASYEMARYIVSV